MYSTAPTDWAIKIDKSETQAVIKYLQKKEMKPKEIQEDIIQILAKDSPSYAIVKKTVEFKQSRG